jgi:hypothetical protein
VAQAGAEWDREQASIMARLAPDSGIDQRLRDQLNARMHAMPARQTVTSAEAARHAAAITEMDRRIAATITATTPEQAEAIAAARRALDEARRMLAGFEAEASARLAEAQALRQGQVAEAAERSEKIEALEGRIAEAEAQVAEAAAGSQMHRWAAFVFGRNPELITEAEAKRVAAIFGAGLAIAAALAGSITAVFAEWFETRGVAPRLVRVPVEIEKRVEVETPIEVPVEVERLVYVPIPTGPGTDEALEELLALLPPHVAAELRREVEAGEARRLGAREATLAAG